MLRVKLTFLPSFVSRRWPTWISRGTLVSWLRSFTVFFSLRQICGASLSLTKQPFLSHSLPKKILPDCVRVSLTFEFVTIFFLQSKVVSLVSNTQPWGPGPSINIPQRQGGPVIPPGIGFPFHHLLWLTGLQWRYSNPTPHVENTWTVTCIKTQPLISTYFLIHYSISSTHLTAYSRSYWKNR
jgi:hypothetical protein